MSKYLKSGMFCLLAIAFLTVFCCIACAENNTLSGVVWNDKNANGIFDADEKVYSDATVFLQQPSAEEGCDIEKCKVSSSGEFFFSGVPDGDYRLKVVTGGYIFTTAFCESDILPTLGTTGYTEWQHIEGDRQYKIGVVKSNSDVRVIAYKDEDFNGGRRKSEKLIKGVRFTLLYEKDGVEYELDSISSTNSADHAAEFHKVAPGKYRMKVEIPDGYAATVINKDVITQWYNAFPPTDAEIIYTKEFEVVVREDVGMCAGLVPACGLNGKIWDSDHDSPVPNAVVSLYDKKSEAEYTTESDENGNYVFSRIIAADYEMSVQLPAGKTFSGSGLQMKNSKPGTAVCNVDVKSGKYVEVEQILTVDETSVVISADWSRITNDTDMLFDPDSVSFSLYSEGYGIVCSGTFDDGIAKIRDLNEGDYLISFTFSDGYVADFAIGGSTETIGNDEQISIHIAKGYNEGFVAFAKSCSIRGYVFEDRNNDGYKDDTDRMIAGVKIVAVNQNGDACGNAETNEQGEYIIRGLMPGSYTVRFYAEDPYVAANPGIGHAIVLQTPDYGETSSILLNAGDEISGINGAVFCAYNVSGRIELRNEFLENIDGSAACVKASLYHADGTGVSDFSYDVSDEDGNYMIKGVTPGTYYIVYSIPSNFLFTDPYTDALEYITDVFEVDRDVEMPAVAVLPCGSIEGFAMHGTEPVDFTMELRGSYRDIIYVIETDKDGHYFEPRILPDTYQKTCILDDKYVFGDCIGVIGGFNSNIYESMTEIGVNQIIDEYNFNAVMTGTISGYVYYDYSGDGDVMNAENLPFDKETEVYLIKGEDIIDTAVTDANGKFVFGRIIPGDYRVSLNADEDTQITSPAPEQFILTVADGDNDIAIDVGLIQFASISGSVWNVGESTGAISAIHVYLYNEMINGPVADCYTDENGNFSFTELKPGSYYLAADIPEGYLFARTSDTAMRPSYVTYDEDPVIIELKMGSDIMNCDIGIGAPGRIGDYAWLDLNGNGLFDIGEPQLPGIRIELYSGNELAAETYTDEYGYWDFSDMYPGEYTMKVYMPPEVKTTVLNEEFPNVNSILPPEMTGTAEVKVMIPSNDKDLANDLGFICIEEDVLPEAVKNLPSIDWSFNGTKRYDFDN